MSDQNTTPPPVYGIIGAKAGAAVICALCGAGCDLEGLGTLPTPGPIAVDEKGKPICRGCLQKVDPDLYGAYVGARAEADRREREHLSHLNNRRSGLEADSAKAYTSAGSQHQEILASLRADVERAIHTHPKHLRALAKVASVSASLLLARAAEATRGKQMTRGDDYTARARAEVDHAKAKRTADALAADLVEARADLKTTDEKLRRELAGGIDLPAEEPTPAKAVDRYAEVASPDERGRYYYSE